MRGRIGWAAGILSGLIILAGCSTPAARFFIPQEVSSSTFVITSRYLPPKRENGEGSVAWEHFKALQGPLRRTRVARDEPASELELSLLSRDDFEEDFKRVAAERGATSILLFVHGFNTNLRAAAINAAGFQARLDERRAATGQPYDPVVMTYAWPSKGKLLGEAYKYDRDHVDTAGYKLQEFVTELLSRHEMPVDIVAHSLGTELVLKALRPIETAGLKGTLRDLVLVAPDIDNEKYDYLAKAVRGRVEGTFTIYVNRRDLAIWASFLFKNNQYFRVGAPFEVRSKRLPDETRPGSGPVWVRPHVKGVVMVDVENVVRDELVSHFHYQHPAVFEDIAGTLNGIAPEDRNLERVDYNDFRVRHRDVEIPLYLDWIDEDAVYYMIPVDAASKAEEPW